MRQVERQRRGSKPHSLGKRTGRKASMPGVHERAEGRQPVRLGKRRKGNNDVFSGKHISIIVETMMPVKWTAQADDQLPSGGSRKQSSIHVPQRPVVALGKAPCTAKTGGERSFAL